MSQKPLITVIVPTHNEADNISLIYVELLRVVASMEKYGREIIFVDDGSTDESVAVMRRLAKRDKTVHAVELVRNFGKEIAITAGLHHAQGDAAIMIDADLQHPVDLIPEFLQKWEQGAEVVVGVRVPNKDNTSLFKRSASRWFYRLMMAISDTAVTPNATDFRLVDRVVIEEFNRFTERNRMTRGLIDWLGFTHAYVYFKSLKRVNGRAQYSYRKLVKLAVNGIVAHSLAPLKVAGYLGSLITFVSGLLGVFILIENYIFGDPLKLHFSGPAILGVLILFLVGIILVCLGLIALYIAGIYGEVVNRPLYVERNKRPR